MINEFKFKDELFETRAAVSGSEIEVSVGENKYKILSLAPGKYAVESNGIKKKVCCIIDKGKSYLDVDGILLELTIPSDDGVAGGAAGQGGAKDKIFAPMPGKVVKILVAEGQEVEEKQPMVIVEAMKMENQVNAAAKGKVKKVNFKAGDQVDTETPIIELELAE